MSNEIRYLKIHPMSEVTVYPNISNYFLLLIFNVLFRTLQYMVSISLEAFYYECVII